MQKMKTSFCLFSLLLAAFYLIPASSISAKQNDSCLKGKTDDYSHLTERVLDISMQINLPDPDPRGRMLVDFFQRCIAPVIVQINLNDQASDRIENLFQAVKMVDIPEPSKVHEEFLRRAYSTLISRNKLYSRLAKDVYGSMIASRLFDRAREFNPKPIGTVLPEYHEEKGLQANSKSLIKLTNGGGRLTRRSYTFPLGSHVVIVAHPDCHFSRNAFIQIDKNPRLSKIIARHSTIIMPVGEKLAIKSIAKWNSDNKYQKYPMNYIYNKENWLDINDWSTPTFYFFEKGQLKSKLIGWPKEGHMEELTTKLTQIGLLKTNEGIK